MGSGPPISSGPRRFHVEVAEELLDDLRLRLRATRWPQTIAGSSWAYGADVAYVRDLCEYWADGSEWRAAEARINSYPQYVQEVDGVDLHFWHVAGRGDRPFPLLMLHGWPGSIWEFMELLGPLSDPVAHGGDASDAFDVVVPSLPGFGFSAAPSERGWGITRMAAALDALMLRLGYSRYGTQGGDWGGIISAQIGADHAGRCAAIHVNQTAAALPRVVPEELRSWAERYKAFHASETAYARIQGTKPDSLTLAQNDSPAGLAA